MFMYSPVEIESNAGLIIALKLAKVKLVCACEYALACPQTFSMGLRSQ